MDHSCVAGTLLLGIREYEPLEKQWPLWHKGEAVPITMETSVQNLVFSPAMPNCMNCPQSLLGFPSLKLLAVTQAGGQMFLSLQTLTCSPQWILQLPHSLFCSSETAIA